ncbi:uncharacterized protein LOC126743806 [Anthonomus grandis grandis]|uniref:uncharacterized protein LOC126743806 n=1 Tax=Anthonomus grandis grandis TaxID=2921223 RepID=UPI002166603B|nr:uncharacterized protein LOC126743806 [Anthonomus grandis grandis]
MWLHYIFVILASAYIVLSQDIATSNEDVLKNSILKANDVTFPDYCKNDLGEKVYGTIRFKTDCRKYVQCGHQVEQIMWCQSGLLFNNIKKWCDWPLSANCIDFPAKDKTKLVIPAHSISW